MPTAEQIDYKILLSTPPSTQSHVTSDLYKESLPDTKTLSSLLIATTNIGMRLHRLITLA